MRASNSIPLIPLILLILLLAGCNASSPSHEPSLSATNTAASRVLPSTDVRNVEPWSFGPNPGKVISTDYFAIYTTENANIIVDRMPRFLETSLRNYLTALTPTRALPPPPVKLETYIMGSRAQWKQLTIDMLGARGVDLLNIQAGGFAFGGRSFLFDIGAAGILSVAAHEGWHQYTQRTFAEMMPVWLEEGIATYMEGHKWGGQPASGATNASAQSGTVVFLPWANIDRFEQLFTASNRGELISLEDLLQSSPQQLIVRPGNAAVNYYAQLWSLILFLNEGAGGRYRPALQQVIVDAQAGKLSDSIATRLNMQGRSGALAARSGIAAFKAYFANDIKAVDAEYQAFMMQIVRTGGRDAIVEGRSPIR